MSEQAVARNPSERALGVTRPIPKSWLIVFRVRTERLPEWWGLQATRTPPFRMDLHRVGVDQSRPEEMGFHCRWNGRLDRFVALVTVAIIPQQ